MIDLSHTGNAIDRQLGLYQEQAETWKLEHARAIDCLNVEAIINLGLGIYQSIRRADQEWSRAVQLQTSPLREEDVKKLKTWYSWWIQPCQMLLSEIQQLETDGYRIEHGAAFRDACLQVYSALSIPLEQALSPDGGGRGRTMQEVRDAVRGRLEQAGR